MSPEEAKQWADCHAAYDRMRVAAQLAASACVAADAAARDIARLGLKAESYGSAGAHLHNPAAAEAVRTENAARSARESFLYLLTHSPAVLRAVFCVMETT